MAYQYLTKMQAKVGPVRTLVQLMKQVLSSTLHNFEK